ncbi:ATP-binding protein [Cytobacillus spongiae]|uniref:ATP-binding protein n=1 Tax=Cytobacillus spongiae TaxID=2901381 RepID=UPI001F2D3D42|nr:ATP-binding protein [Cytobacillus spongiae]UII54343.1 ATP-binding protein [Cytobacillus spongiae]
MGIEFISIIKDLLLNLFFILILCCFVPFYLKHLGKSMRKWVPFFYSLAIILCITFPIKLTEDFIFDLRGVPMLVGGVYGGPVAIVTYAVISVVYRSLFGGLGIITTLMNTTLMLIASLLIVKKFHQYSFRQKLTVVPFVSALLSILLLFAPQMIFGLELSVPLFAGFLLITVFSNFLLVYLIENFREYSFLRERVMRAEKLEVVSHLTASISHEVRNPLTTTRGMLQLLREDQGLEHEKKQQYFQIALEELARAEKVIADYLTFAKPSTSHIDARDVEREILRTVEVMRPLANMNSITINCNLQTFTLICSAEKFQQCLVNIIKNSIEAMPNGGKIYIETYASQDEDKIIIQDEGLGMTKDQISKLGLPYYTTKGMKGTGLGLMLVFRMIESMNGIIDVESDIGKGTTFIMRFKK